MNREKALEIILESLRYHEEYIKKNVKTPHLQHDFLVNIWETKNYLKENLK